MQDVDPGVDDSGRVADLSPEFRRKSVLYRTEQPAGTIIVNTSDRYLYLIMGNGTALRYGIGVGRDGFQWGGIQKITLKREWPDWVPPPEMIQRQPYLPRWMAGGPGNPLGARAMNLGATVYRIHGTNAPQTIGQAVQQVSTPPGHLGEFQRGVRVDPSGIPFVARARPVGKSLPDFTKAPHAGKQGSD